MARPLPFLMALLLISGPVAAQDAAFNRATEAYAKGDDATATTAFRTAAGDGSVDAALSLARKNRDRQAERSLQALSATMPPQEIDAGKALLAESEK